MERFWWLDPWWLSAAEGAIVVTHDERMIEGFDRVYQMTDGRITNHQSLIPVEEDNGMLESLWFIGIVTA